MPSHVNGFFNCEIPSLLISIPIGFAPQYGHFTEPGNSPMDLGGLEGRTTHLRVSVTGSASSADRCQRNIFTVSGTRHNWYQKSTAIRKSAIVQDPKSGLALG